MPPRSTPIEKAEDARLESGTDVGAAVISKEMVGEDLHARIVVAYHGGPTEVDVCVLRSDVVELASRELELAKMDNPRLCAAVEQEVTAMTGEERAARLGELAANGPWRLDPGSLSALEIRRRLRQFFGP